LFLLSTKAFSTLISEASTVNSFIIHASLNQLFSKNSLSRHSFFEDPVWLYNRVSKMPFCKGLSFIIKISSFSFLHKISVPSQKLKFQRFRLISSA
jgi:hypothetical protein